MNRRSFLLSALAAAPAIKLLGAMPASAISPLFEDVTANSGIRFKHESSRTSQKYLPESMGAGVAMFDYDNNGWLDLFFVNGAKIFDPMPRGSSPDKSDPRFWNRLYHNNGDGTFTDVSKKCGVESSPGKGLGIAIDDFDGDGWPDIFVANDSVAEQLFRNNHDGTFTEVALLSGLAYDQNGHAFAGMGADFGDYKNTGWPSVFVNALANQKYKLFRNDKGTFDDVTDSIGLGASTMSHSGWGAKWIDYDNDGWLDLFIAQGHVMDNIQLTEPTLRYLEPPLLLKNEQGRFSNVSSQSGSVFTTPIAARGSAFGDLDNDGLVDVGIN